MDILDELNSLFCKVFNDKEIVIKPETTANDIERWDSLSHANLVYAIEIHFKIKLNNREIINWKNVGEMIETIKTKLAK